MSPAHTAGGICTMHRPCHQQPMASDIYLAAQFRLQRRCLQLGLLIGTPLRAADKPRAVRSLSWALDEYRADKKGHVPLWSAQAACTCAASERRHCLLSPYIPRSERRRPFPSSLFVSLLPVFNQLQLLEPPLLSKLILQMAAQGKASDQSLLSRLCEGERVPISPRV
jgi:hypothetical protein